MPEGYVDMVITSPPYWALRDYGTNPEVWDGNANCKHQWSNWTEKRDIREETTHAKSRTTDRYYGDSSRKFNGNHQKHMAGQFCKKCDAWRGELGNEPNFELYIKHLCDIFDEIKRILKKEGTCWVNLGDSYSNNSSARNIFGNPEFNKNRPCREKIKIPSKKCNLPNKTLCLIPERFAIEMVNRGWILRNEIIWHKTNCMPSSVKDRFTIDFEKLFFFSKTQKYYFEQQFEQADQEENIYRNQLRQKKDYNLKDPYKTNFPIPQADGKRNKRCVWSISTKPFPEAHFAVYPEGLIETPIKAGCPKKGIVLDPFIGSGTTALVALKLNRRFVGIELKQKYIQIAKKRIKPELEQKRLI